MLASSSACTVIGFRPVTMQSASFEVVRNAFAILMFISRCTLLYILLLHFFSSALIHTGAPYGISGIIAPVYIVRSASLLSPHFNFADFDRLCISFVHLFAVYSKCSLKFILLSMIIPKYFILSTCPSFTLFM